MKQRQQPTAKAAEAGPARLVLTLSLAGLLSGLIIVSVFEATLPTITAYKAKVLRESVFKVLPGTVNLKRLVYSDGKLGPAEVEEKDQEAVFGGYDTEGELVGYAVPGAGPGFQDIISLLYGYLPGVRKVVGMEILESRETPGLGDKIYKDLEFVANFHDLAIEPEIVVVKKGQKAAPNEIDAITGATISSKAVARIINQANQLWLPRLESFDPVPDFKNDLTRKSTKGTKKEDD